MLGHPSLVASHGGGDTQGKALLAEQGIAAITGAIAHDQSVLREVRDVGILRGAGPGDILLSCREGRSDRMEAFHKFASLGNLVVNLRTHPCHGAHVRYDVGAIRDLDAVLGDRRADRTHAEGHHIESASLHASLQEAIELSPHHGRIAPVIGGAGILFGFAADESALLDASHIAGITADKQRVGSLVGIEPKAGTGTDDTITHQLVLGSAAVAPEDRLRLRQSCNFVNPIRDLLDCGLVCSQFRAR